jgi:hypothetical protein
MNETEVKRIQLNSARAAYEAAQADYISTLNPEKAAEMRSQDPEIQQQLAEAEADYRVSNILLNSLENTLKYHSVPTQTAELITSLASETTEDLQKEIEETKAKIRFEKRKFLDSSPQVSTGPFYYAGVPDNQVLITFLICYGSFWLFLGIMLLSNQIPLPYISGMSSGDRLKLVGISWILIIIVTYFAFFMFT